MLRHASLSQEYMLKIWKEMSDGDVCEKSNFDFHPAPYK